MAAWARDVTMGRCTVDEPHGDVRLSLSMARDRAAREKSAARAGKRGPGSGSDFNVDDFMKVIAASSLSISQLAQSQVIGGHRQPVDGQLLAAVGSSSTSAAPASGWRDLTYNNLVELSSVDNVCVTVPKRPYKIHRGQQTVSWRSTTGICVTSMQLTFEARTPFMQSRRHTSRH